MSVLGRFLAKQVSPNACSCRSSSSVAQAVTPLLSGGVRPTSAVYIHKLAYLNGPAACSDEPAAYANTIVAISCFTPAPADRLHYSQGLPGGGLYSYGA